MPSAEHEKPNSQAQSQNKFQVLRTIPSNQPKQTFAQKVASSS